MAVPCDSTPRLQDRKVTEQYELTLWAPPEICLTYEAESWHLSEHEITLRLKNLSETPIAMILPGREVVRIVAVSDEGQPTERIEQGPLPRGGPARPGDPGPEQISVAPGMTWTSPPLAPSPVSPLLGRLVQGAWVGTGGAVNEEVRFMRPLLLEVRFGGQIAIPGLEGDQLPVLTARTLVRIPEEPLAQ